MSAAHPPTSIAVTSGGYNPYTGVARRSARRMLDLNAHRIAKHPSLASIVNSDDDQLNG